jgi:hypothetical protein
MSEVSAEVALYTPSLFSSTPARDCTSKMPTSSYHSFGPAMAASPRRTYIQHRMVSTLPCKTALTLLTPIVAHICYYHTTCQFPAVISGFGEVGPWGSSHTWWEMEANGHLTLEGCIEMVWMVISSVLTVISRRALFTWAGLTRRLVHMKVTSL